MSAVFIASYIVLWGVVVVLVLLVLDLSRRFRPVEETLNMQHRGLPRGNVFPRLRLPTITGREVQLPNAQRRNTVVVFTSPGCSACRTLYPALQPFLQKNQQKLQVVMVSIGEEQEVRNLVQEQGFSVPVCRVAHDELPEFGVDIYPFAYLLSPDGHVLAKGVTSSERHLNLLLSAGHRAS